MSFSAPWSEITEEEENQLHKEAQHEETVQPSEKKSKKKGGSQAKVDNEEGIRTVVEYHTNEKGQKVKVTKKIRVYKNIRKINKRVEERRQNWKKFGKTAGVEGIEAGVTSLCEEVSLVLGDEERKKKQQMIEDKQDEEEIKRMYASIIATGNNPPAKQGSGAPGGQQAWRSKVLDRNQAGITGGPSKTGAPATTAGGKPLSQAYVAPRLRDKSAQTEDDATIRVTNLSEDITEEDLKDRFRPFGDISRVFLAKDKQTGKSKGFAFINFKSKQNAQTAMDNMNGKGWDFLILNVEWAKPSNPH